MSRVLVVGAIALCLAQAVSAEMLQIQMGGVDLRYDGSVVRDLAMGGADPLTNATFLVDGELAGVRTAGVALDLHIPGVLNIPASAGGTVYSDANGSLYLHLGDGDFLSLALGSAAVTYIPVYQSMIFVFVGTAASVEGQQLPFGLSIGDPIQVSFSTQTIGNIGQAGGVVTSFTSAGTGEIMGVPEPMTLGLLAVAGLAVLRRRRSA